MGWAFVKGWHFGKTYPSEFNRPFGHLVQSQIVEHYVRTSGDLSVLRVPESVNDLVVRSVANENAFPGSRFEFAAVVFRYEGISLTSKNPQFVIIRLTTGL